MFKLAIAVLALTLIMGCRNRNGAPATSSKQSSPAVQQAEVASNDSQKQTEDKKKAADPQAKYDIVNLSFLSTGQLVVVVKKPVQIETNTSGTIPVHMIKAKNNNFMCDFEVLAFDAPREGKTYRHFSAPKIENGMLTIAGRIVSFESAVKQKTAFYCIASNKTSLSKFTVGDLKSLFSDSLEIKIEESK